MTTHVASDSAPERGPLPPPASPLTGREAATLLQLHYPGPFNYLRRRLEQYVDDQPGAERRLLPLPQFASRVAERSWRKEHIIVVPELGGVSYYGTDWTYEEGAVLNFRKRVLGPHL